MLILAYQYFENADPMAWKLAKLFSKTVSVCEDSNGMLISKQEPMLPFLVFEMIWI